MSPLRRRRFLGALALLTAAGGFAAYRFRNADVVRRALFGVWGSVDPLAENIVAHFPDLDLDPAGVAAFVADYQSLGRETIRSRRETDLYLRYLASTDAFDADRDPNAPIRYVAFFDPYVTPCRNPFARFDDA